jgi:TrpR-related protein YerC/YecD
MPQDNLCLGGTKRFNALKCFAQQLRAEEVQMADRHGDASHEQMVERLCVALCALETPEEAHALLADLCTKRETSELAQRLEVAVMLRAGRSYMEVSRVTGASSTTVSRVSKCLNGEVGGYRLVLDRLDADER